MRTSLMNEAQADPPSSASSTQAAAEHGQNYIASRQRLYPGLWTCSCGKHDFNESRL